MTKDTNDQDDIIANFAQIFGEPPLLRKEDRKPYLALKDAVWQEMKPKSIFDQLHAHDVVNKISEERQFKRNQAALLEGGLVQSLAALLAPADGENHEGALQDALDYYSGDPKKSRPVEKLLAKKGISPQHIEANAIHMHSVSLHTLDRMISIRETARNGIIKNFERQQRKAAKTLRKKHASNGHSDGSDEPDQPQQPRPFGWVRDGQ